MILSNNILNLSVILPLDLKMAKQFSELLNLSFREVSGIRRENKEPKRLRNCLFSKLMNGGQVTVTSNIDPQEV